MPDDATEPCTDKEKPDKEEEEDKCTKLRREIDELINRNKHDPDIPNTGRGRHGLVHRFRELISTLSKWAEKAPSLEDVIHAQNHINEIEKAKATLAEKLTQLKPNDCGDPPSGAWSWAGRPTKGYQEQVDSAKQRLALQGAALSGATVGAGYVVYRIIRMIPSLFPPLWETIPVNLAIP